MSKWLEKGIYTFFIISVIKSSDTYKISYKSHEATALEWESEICLLENTGEIKTIFILSVWGETIIWVTGISASGGPHQSTKKAVR